MDELFSRMYEAGVKVGRPSIAPEKLLRAMLLQILFSVRSECQFMEQTQYNLLFRWFIGLATDDAAWVPTVQEPPAPDRARCGGGLLQRSAGDGREQGLGVG